MYPYLYPQPINIATGHVLYRTHESPSGHHIAVPASLYQDLQHRETGPRAGFFVPVDLPLSLPIRCVPASLYPHLYPEKNTELWDTRMKRAAPLEQKRSAKAAIDIAKARSFRATADA